MCHPEAPADQGPHAEAHDVSLPLPSGERLPAEVALPDGGQGPGVLILVDIYGCTPFYRQLNRRLAAAGYVSLLPDVFFRLGELPEVTREAAFARKAELDDARALDDLATAAAWLAARDDTGGSRLGLLGFCMGGTFALDLAAQRADVATVGYYAFPRGMPNSSAPAPLDVVDRLQGPMLCFWGDQDYIDMDDVTQLGDEARDQGKDYHAIVYPGVGHGFLRGLVEDGPEHEAAHDSWQRALAFFAAHLPASATR